MVKPYIETVKKMLLKAKSDCNDQFLVLLEYKNVSISNNLSLPSELLFGRKINGLLPIKETFHQIGKNLDIKNKAFASTRTAKI